MIYFYIILFYFFIFIYCLTYITVNLFSYSLFLKFFIKLQNIILNKFLYLYYQQFKFYFKNINQKSYFGILLLLIIIKNNLFYF